MLFCLVRVPFKSLGTSGSNRLEISDRGHVEKPAVAVHSLD